MTFDSIAVDNLVAALESVALETGEFRRVNFHEPKAAPGTGLSLAMWVDSLEPLGAASGADATSGYLVVNARVYGNMIQKPEDEIDPRLTKAMVALISKYTSGFTLNSHLRAIDLLGMYGMKLGFRTGYLTLDSHLYRIMDLSIPCIINDLFTMEA